VYINFLHVTAYLLWCSAFVRIFIKETTYLLTYLLT